MLLFSNFIIKINVKIINFAKKILEIPVKLIIKIIRKIFFKPIAFFIINIKKSTKNITKKILNPKKM